MRADAVRDVHRACKDFSEEQEREARVDRPAAACDAAPVGPTGIRRGQTDRIREADRPHVDLAVKAKAVRDRKVEGVQEPVGEAGPLDQMPKATDR